ncbi:MAG: caspase family protein [Bradyrhizobium sp.]|uniref:caspase family protein n=1 Tax=Bradyrhizobium sp. TaxID=376 RepID=UPI0025C3E3A8|nr:caspase family protein [Bradyrhizobium sp.]MBI5261145.1 caspase family protein [Bradyrhizobium sp.]
MKLALDDLAASISAAPRPAPQPFSLRATIYTVLERFDHALSDLAEAIRADPKISSHHVQRAIILERLDRFSEARTELDTAVQFDPGNQNAWINRAILWARYGDFEQALADYDRAETAGGSQTWYALSGRARLAYVVGEPQRAFADWTRAAETSPLPMLAAQFHVRAGNLARDYLKDLDKALHAYGRALAVLPTYAQAVIERGLAYERSKRFDEAASEYRKAGDMTRTNPMDKATYDYSLFRLEVLRARLSRRAGDPLPPNIDVLSRSASIGKQQGRRIALVIGNAAYANVPPLMNSDRDAESVGAALSEAGFAQVTVGRDLDRNQLEASLQQFAREAAGADWAVIYYAGHGIEVDGVNYAIPVDASMDTLRDAPSHAISIDQMVAAVGPAKHLHMIVLDACRDDPFVQQAHRIAARKRTFDKSTDTALDQLLARRKEIGGGLAGLKTEHLNMVALYSTQPGEVTLDGDEFNSPFTRALLKNLPTPNLDLRSFFDRVRDEVTNGTQGRQRPAFNGRLREGERFFFFPTR